MIWCVDDDGTIRDIEVYALESTGFSAKGFSSGDEVLSALEKEIPSLIILDIMMPGTDGVTVLKKIRENINTKHIPVIMATAKGTEMDKIQSLDLGADDYLVKPFGVMEMVSRVKAVLRRCEHSASRPVLNYLGIVLNEKEHTVSFDGEKENLTLKEFDLLKLFMKNPGTVFSREQLLFEIWGESYLGESRTVDVHIKTLRKKMGTYGKNIVTVIGVGYKLEDAT